MFQHHVVRCDGMRRMVKIRHVHCDGWRQGRQMTSEDQDCDMQGSQVVRYEGCGGCGHASPRLAGCDNAVSGANKSKVSCGGGCMHVDIC